MTKSNMICSAARKDILSQDLMQPMFQVHPVPVHPQAGSVLEPGVDYVPSYGCTGRVTYCGFSFYRRRTLVAL